MPKNHTFEITQEECLCCECDRCNKIAADNGGSYAAVLLALLNDIARDLGPVRSDVTIGKLAYAWSRTPRRT